MIILLVLSFNSNFSARLSIKDVDGNPMIIVLPDMPKDLKERALSCIATLYEHILVDTDTESLKEEYKYPSYHFSWYNRYAKHVSSL